MRDHEWLEEQLKFLLKTYFANVNISNPIQIKFGRDAKYRFGSIKLISHRRRKGIKSISGLIRAVGDDTPKKSLITITSMFAGEDVPVDVVRYTIAHELCHYAHGFSSMNKQMFRHPHHGGIINKELERRGAAHLTREFKAWLKGYRKAILSLRVKI